MLKNINQQEKNMKIIFIFYIITFYHFSAFSAETFNWATWKGPNKNGISDETDWNPEALNKELKINWQIKVGVGYSNVSIKDDYLYTMGYDKKTQENIIYCLNVLTGKEVWQHSYPSSLGKYEGPRSTPIVDNDKLYSLSQDGELICQNTANGKIIWQKNLVKEFGVSLPRWKLSTSVCIEGDLAIVNANTSGIAFNKNTGKLAWTSDTGKGNYSTPITFKIKDELYSAIYGLQHLYAVNLKNGKIKWSFPWKSKYNIIAADPYIHNEKIFISTGYGNGCTLIDISKDEPKQLWQNKDLCTHFSTIVILDNYIYGIDGNAGYGELKCLDIKDGSVMWNEKLGSFNFFNAS
ncbi:hypothetical protein BVX93_00940 [bacterium B13(2017)]|nr:hypothetical protein BVX93_00940 [bacterium B13(2017)]